MDYLLHIFFDIVCLTIIIVFIRLMYQMSYSREAIFYIENQFGTLGSSGISCIIVLSAYYYLENTFQIDTKYMGGLVLTVFLILGGKLSNLLYERYFKLSKSRYRASDEEYLFVVSIVFLSISLKMVLRGIINLTIPISLLLGRYLWLDTRTFKSVKEAMRINHRRVLESAVLLSVGMVLITVITECCDQLGRADIVLAAIYGLFIILPYRIIRNRGKGKDKK